MIKRYILSIFSLIIILIYNNRYSNILEINNKNKIEYRYIINLKNRLNNLASYFVNILGSSILFIPILLLTRYSIDKIICINITLSIIFKHFFIDLFKIINKHKYEFYGILPEYIEKILYYFLNEFIFEIFIFTIIFILFVNTLFTYILNKVIYVIYIIKLIKTKIVIILKKNSSKIH